MFGHRPDGILLRGIDPIQKIIPHIMPQRYDAQNMTHFECDCEPMDAFTRTQRDDAGEDFNQMDIVIAALVRIFAEYPRLNRFVMNGRIFARKGILISFVVKKELSFTAPDSLVKLAFTGHESIYEVRDKIDKAIQENGNTEANNGTDKLARLLTLTPNFVLKLLIGTIKWLDKHGMLPQAILNVSPFHASCFVTNLKSIKGPSIYHHLYEFGTTGLFVSMGKESEVPVKKGEEIAVGKLMPMDFVMDERFCDGFYYVKAMNDMKRMLRNPAVLTKRLDTLVEDVDVIDRHSRRYKRAAAKAAQQQ